jgi:spore germination protein KC
MKRLRAICLIIIILANTLLCSGCWNYREIEKLAIVAGMAIDMDKIDKRYILTVEIATPDPSEKGGGSKSEVYETKGATIFEAVRNLIVEIGRRAYWSHSKVVIIEKSIAEEQGISSVLDFVYRDSETRRDVLVLISDESTAGEILKESLRNRSELLSYKIDASIRSQKSIARFPKTELREVVGNFKSEDSAILVPLIRINKFKGENDNTTEVFGSGILKGDKVVGYLNGDETKMAILLQGKLKGGLFIARDMLNSEEDMTFEIYGNKTKKKVELSDSELKMKISVKTDVGIAEAAGAIDFSDEKNFKNIKAEAEKRLKTQLEAVLKKVQQDYKADIFDFGEEVEVHQNKQWKKNKSNWSEVFASMPVDINTEITIRGSALVSKPIKGGE